ncbi:NACHT, LRR and PYD domains-containing protein 3-like [Sinocyclocheilus rhinocerous]|uniref:NACHT, LRR and PYD domains-containing protein 3-like n=1 Tax=Sinocyclocheilus rhinocerous TaxID=307959 RepID=UPI0007B8429A|nr:PREDICTED: NACHT, LRR and PYD domains-containing protein 3-like [Sinocyclocheilus rhinocerous]
MSFNPETIAKFELERAPGDTETVTWFSANAASNIKSRVYIKTKLKIFCYCQSSGIVNGDASFGIQHIRGQRDKSKSCDGLNVSIAAQSGSHITAPVISNNNIIGNVQIIHNAPGCTGHHPNTQNEKTKTSERRSVLLKYKQLIRNEYQYVTEYNSLPGEHVLLSDRYTQPLIIQKHRDRKELEEEISARGETFQQVRGSRSSQESIESISLDTLFNPDSRGISPGAVILQGNSGNGKSFTVQKMMMDWACDLYRTKFDVVFHVKCKEISHISSRMSLVELLSYNSFLTSDEISTILQRSPERVLFLVDGFDELKYTEDFYRMLPPTDQYQKAPPEVTLCALLRGRILRESCLLVTTRSTAIDILKNVLKEPHSFTEIVGFSEKGVEEYFKKFFQNDRLFRKGYEYVSANETLLTTCSIPVICWIICTVIRERLNDGADVTSGLETTTSIYVDFLCTLLEHHSRGSGQSVPTLVKSLGQLAEKGILAQQVLFDEKTVYEMVSDPAGSPFLCKFLFKKRIHQETMFSFMHLSFQEFFTALYYLLMDEYESKKKLMQMFSIHESNINTEYSAPRFAAVVHFIFGLLNEDVRRTLWKRHGLFVHSNIQDHLKEWIFEEMSHSRSERILFLFHCLYELHEEDVVKEVTEACPSVILHNAFIRKADCWSMVYCAQCCQCIKDLFIFCCNFTSEELAIIQPVLHKFLSIKFHAHELSDSDLGGMMNVLMREQTLSSQSVEIIYWVVKTFYLEIREELSR